MMGKYSFSFVIMIALFVLISTMVPHAIRAQDTPDYHFLLLSDRGDGLLFRVDCRNGECTTAHIPLPQVEECDPYDTIVAPMPDGTRTLVVVHCDMPVRWEHRAYWLDMQETALVEFEPEPQTADALAATLWASAPVISWSQDGTFIVCNLATAPGSFAIAFYDPAAGLFTAATSRIGGRFLSFSPDGAHMLVDVEYHFPPAPDGTPLVSYGEVAVADTAYVTQQHKLGKSMLLTDEQMLNGDFVAHGWLSNDEIWLEDLDSGLHYRFDLRTNTLADFEPPAGMPVLYGDGIGARLNGSIITILDANSGAVLDELSFSLPDEFAVDRADCERCALYWLNAN